jgi:hypothetical protein
MDKTYWVMIIFAGIFGLALGVQPLINVENTNKILTRIDNETRQTHKQVNIIFGLIGINESNVDDIAQILNVTGNNSGMYDALHNNVTK